MNLDFVTTLMLLRSEVFNGLPAAIQHCKLFTTVGVLLDIKDWFSASNHPSVVVIDPEDAVFVIVTDRHGIADERLVGRNRCPVTRLTTSLQFV